MYTTSGSGQGNQALTNPIGLITADEVAMAGGVNDSNNTSYYLYTGQDYWTMSPYQFRSGEADVYYVSLAGNLDWDYVGWSDSGVRPVINLRSDV